MIGASERPPRLAFEAIRVSAERPGALLIALVALGALCTSTASAKVMTGGGARYDAVRTAPYSAANARQTDGLVGGVQLAPLYRGAGVDHQLTTRVIYWSPSGHTIPHLSRADHAGDPRLA